MNKPPRLSLLSLLLIAGTVAALVAMYVSDRRRRTEGAEAARERASLQTEIEELRIKQSHLVIDDANKAYVVEVQTDEQWIGGKLSRWRYRVYLPELPPSTGHSLRVCKGTIPTSGYPDWDDWRADHPGPELSYGIGGQSVRAGEHLIDFAIVEGEDGRWRLRYSLGNHGGGGVGVDKADWMLEPNRAVNLAPAKVAQQQEFPPLEPIPLMRIAERTDGLNDRFEGLRRGILVYLEPNVHGRGDISGPEAAKYIDSELDSRDD